MQSIENDRPLNLSGQYFETETPLYEKEWKPSDIPVTVVVPDFYHIALPNLGHQMVEFQLNEQDGIYADRAYLSDNYSLLKEQPQLTPEVVFVSMSYEGSYIRSLRMLDLMGIPLRRKERQDSDPLVVFGGWSVSRNPLPLFDIADLIGVGGSENLIKAIASAYRDNRAERDRIFNQLSEETGIIIPSRYKVKTNNGYLEQWEAEGVATDIYPARNTRLPHSLYLSPDTDYNDIGYYDRKTFFSMEIVDACKSKCAFCASGFRDIGHDVQNPGQIVEMAQLGARHGADLVKLFFPANSSQEATKEIMRGLMADGLSPRVGSAKAEYIDQEYINLIGQSGQEKIAFAPETGDYELRRALGKPGMTQDVLRNVILASVNAGIPNLDFYLIMNLPGESEDSFQMSADMLADFQDFAIRNGLAGRVRMSAPNFFPKAGTPFQYAKAGGIEDYVDKMESLDGQLAGRVKVTSMKGSVDLLSQNIMSRGGNEAGELMVQVYNRLNEQEAQNGQFIPDTLDDWRAAMADLGISERTYFDGKSTEKKLPWHHIHSSKIPQKTLVKAWDVFRERRGILVFD